MKQNKIIKRIASAVGIVAVAAVGAALSFAVVGFVLFCIALFLFVLLTTAVIYFVRFLLWCRRRDELLENLDDPYN